MRKTYSFFLLFTAVIFCCTSSAFSDNEIIISKQSGFNIVNSTPDKVEFTSSVGSIWLRNVKTDNGNYIRINIDKYGKSTVIGSPELPVLHRLIEIPMSSEVRIEITDYQISEYNLSERGVIENLIPMQLSQPKCGSSRAFEIDESIYAQDEFFQEELVSVDILGILRGANIGRLNISPVRYNPVTNIIQVVEQVSFEIYFEGADFASTTNLKNSTRSPFFNGIYNQLLNNQYKSNERDYITQYPVSYVIISDRMFESQLQPFIQWKKRKGFTIHEAYTDEIGTTTQQIKDYIQGLYNAGTTENPAPSFVLFVGDIAQVPTWNNGDGVTDRNYVEYTGDLFPEIFYGRFSAENTVDLHPYFQHGEFLRQSKLFGIHLMNSSFLSTGHTCPGSQGLEYH